MIAEISFKSVRHCQCMISERFQAFCSEDKVTACREDAVPKNTRKHTSWGVNVKAWAKSRNETKYPTAPEDPSLLSVDEINYWLLKFCINVRQTNGEEYRHEMLHSLFCALNRAIRESHPNLALFN
jgi:hypothetical protein